MSEAPIEINAPKSNIKKRGSKEEVFNGLAIQTGGGLRKADLIKNKRGLIVSKKRSEQGLKQFKNIEKYISDKKKSKEDKPEKEEPEDEEDDEDIPPLPKPESPVALKPEAVQEEKSKSAEPPPPGLELPKPIERKKRGRKPKDMPPAIEEIKQELAIEPPIVKPAPEKKF